MTTRYILAGLVLSLVLSLGCGEEVSQPTTAQITADIDTGPSRWRRLTESQLRQSLWDLLGDDIEMPGPLEPDNRREGLTAVGAAHVSVNPLGFEQYESLARQVARQALDETRRARIMSCEPTKVSEPDDACARDFIRWVGRRLFRRSLTSDEIETRVSLAHDATVQLGDFHQGLEMVLVSFIVSPHFLFRLEDTVAEPRPDGRYPLTGLALASRLSYLLWNSAPDEALLEVAERGDLADPDRLAAEVDRMLSSRWLERGIRALLNDLYAFDRFEDGFRKDPVLFPFYTTALIEAAREQTLQTAVQHLLVDKRDFRDLFTTRKTFLNRQLATLYGVPISTQGDEWVPYEFAEDSARVGILSHASFLALYGHPGRSSATLRGRFVREQLLCMPIPPPPGDVDFSLVEEGNSDLPTLRDRVQAHIAQPACAGCHELTDPIGLAMEQFDSLGAYREYEGGFPIDPSGELDGVPFEDFPEFGKVLSDHNALPQCFVTNVLKSACGQAPNSGETSMVDTLVSNWQLAGHTLESLLRAIATHPLFDSLDSREGD